VSRFPPTNYADYLALDKLLSLQKRRSEQFGTPAHDETLFIIVHQVYELWFKQILTELDSVMALFGNDSVDDRNMRLIVGRLHRVCEIQKLLIDQIGVLETMTPLDFLDFRDYLHPASGFQSVQFRLIENKLGLQAGQRLRFNDQPYESYLSADAKRDVVAAAGISLFDLVEKWLERTPFVSFHGYSFWQDYRQAVHRMFENDKALLKSHPNSVDSERAIDDLEQTAKMFDALFDRERYQELRENGVWRLSYSALHAALFINLYRDQPILHLPYQLLTALAETDEMWTTWRYRHALMVHRMIGSKLGTGGSAGHKYLRAATEKHKIFTDLLDLSTYFIPRSWLPALPAEVESALGYRHS
jgi:tryptophan 2,3-dioxygenase